MFKDEMTEKFNEAVEYLSAGLRYRLLQVPNEIKREVQEVRIRASKPLTLICHSGVLFVTQSGRTTYLYNEGLHMVEKGEVEESFRVICGYSIHSHKDEIINGYITLPGGHRAGLCGTATVENNKIIGVRNISSINLRIARQIKGIADQILNTFFSHREWDSLLIAGPPSSGKTTVLRDLTAQLASGQLGKYMKTTIIDERGELAAVYSGQAQNDVGVNCDILDGYPKASGIMIALRTLSPDIIVCDELGDESDIRAVEAGVNAGVKFLATIHAGCKEELMRRTQIQRLLQTGAFSQVLLLKGKENPGEMKEIYDVGELLHEIYGVNNDYSRRFTDRKILLCPAHEQSTAIGTSSAYAAID